MKSTLAGRWQAAVCAAILPVAALIIQPRVESGIVDDGPYIAMVQDLLRTGHFTYNGWESAMMGVLVAAGALFAKLFGTSFTAIRLTVLLIASLTGFVVQRLFVRCALTPWNASLATIALLVCPLFLPYTFTFMTDVPGVFGIAVCLYFGARALQTTEANHAILWLCLAAVCGVTGGTCRQTVWLGAVVMVPAVACCLRQSRRVLIAGALLTLLSAASILAELHWFSHQPYTLSEAVLRHSSFSKELSNFLYVATHTAPVIPFLLTPVLLAFLPTAMRSSNRSRLIVLAGPLIFMLLGLLEYYRHSLANWLTIVPGTGVGGVGYFIFMGARTPIYGMWWLLGLWAVMLAGTFAFLAFCFATQWPALRPAAHGLSWRQLAWLLTPLTVGYLILLLPRAIYEEIYSRYLLPLVLICLLAVVRVYQERVARRLPAFVIALVVLTAAWSIAIVHDGFAEDRGEGGGLQGLTWRGGACDPYRRRWGVG